MRLVLYSIHDYNYGWVYKILWAIYSFSHSYVSIVKHTFKTMKLGNIFQSFGILVTGFIFARQCVVADYETLEQDLFIFQELKDTYPRSTSNV